MTRARLDENGCYVPHTGRWCFSCGKPVWRTDGSTEYCAACEAQTYRPNETRKEM